MLLVPVAFIISHENAPRAIPTETATVPPGVDRRQGSLFIEVDIPERNEISRTPEQIHFIGRMAGAVSQSPELLSLIGGHQIVRLGDFEGAL